MLLLLLQQLATKSINYIGQPQKNQKIKKEISTEASALVGFKTGYGPGARFSKVPKNHIRKTPTRLFCKDGLFICCKGNKN